MPERKNIYVASGKVKVQVKPATKHKPAFWVSKEFTAAIVSGMDEEEAKGQLTSSKIFPGKEEKWMSKKPTQIIEVNFKFLSKANH